jgi:hypothetical protein
MTLRLLRLLVAAPLLSAPCAAEEIPVLREGSPAFTFAVLGDIHYTPPEYKEAQLIHRVAAEIRAHAPAVDFVCQTGDIAEGGTYVMRDGKKAFVLADYAEMKSQHTFAVRDLTQSFRLPVFIAVGNHDKHDRGARAYGEIVLPMISNSLGRLLTQRYYAFRYGNACFVFLDPGSRDEAEQARFLDRVLTEAERGGRTQHVFLFAHDPLWPVVRPGFSSRPFTAAIMPVLARHRTDAFFASHTHNAIVCVRDFQGTRLTQIQGITTQEKSDELVPIEKRHVLLFPAQETPYCWGYREGSPSGYYLVRVDGRRVGVQFRVPGHGLVREFYWDTPGQLVDVKRPAPEPPIHVNQSALARAREAAIVVHPWADSRTPVTVLLNGQPLLQTEIKPSYCPFWHEQRIAIPADKLDRLQVVNRLQVANPTAAAFAFASARLEVTLADGTQVATPPTREFCFSFERAQSQGKGQAKPWQIAPPDMVQAVPLGQPLGPVELRFPAE